MARQVRGFGIGQAEIRESLARFIARHKLPNFQSSACSTKFACNAFRST